MAVKIGTEAIRAMAALEKIAKVHARDCLVTENVVYFLVNPGKIGLAIGKNGANISGLRRVLGRNVRIFAFASSPQDFIRGIVPEARSVKEENGVLNVSIYPKDRSLIIGRNGETIRAVRRLLKRHYGINDLKLKM